MAQSTTGTDRHPPEDPGRSPATDEERPAHPGSRRIRTNWTVFGGTAVGILAITGWAALAPETAQAALGAVVSWVAANMGWFYILTGTVVIVFVLVVAFGRQGRTRLGPDHFRPQFPLFSWASMLFAAGIGVDLMFFSVLEPVTQYYAPPQGGGESAEAARQAVVWTLFHYGLTGWAMYALMGLAFGYFAYRFNLPLSIRSALYPIIGRRIKGRTGDAVDIAAMLGTIFGVATSLGIGVVMINFGLGFLFGLPQGLGVQAALIGLSVLLAVVSAVSGVDKGIRRLSELNVLLAIGLMLYVLVFGRTEFLLNGIVTNLGDYLSGFPGLTMDAMAFDHPDQWMSDWTLFFWAWWVAWSPFVGLFLARISRGRTIRQFVLGVLTIPFAFILLWISIFGNSALGIIHEQGDDGFGQTVMNGQEEAFYTLLAQYPGAIAAVAIATFTGLLFYVTSADSGALVMSNFCSHLEDPQQDGPNWMRIFWAAATGALTLAMLSIGGVATLQSATIIFGLPFALVLYLIMFGLWRALRVEGAQADASRAAWAGVRAADRAAAIEPSARTRSWRQRLTRTVSYPGARAAGRYVESVVGPAFREVAEEMRAAGSTPRRRTASTPPPGCPTPPWWSTWRASRTSSTRSIRWPAPPRTTCWPRSGSGSTTTGSSPSPSPGPAVTTSTVTPRSS
ncbi:choline BCCT transporter BetT [Rothia sp. AR01]|uniref:Choline BCCT transporter BetT n=1 Tax=Rothia santali TaxID=2949643 RepID=A0A9X2HEV9_9MICC|nr:choline BCCT transporter BetT [Rothia santali]MCP3426432.1 choline BCCT transporter BetT [Rothia santali]